MTCCSMLKPGFAAWWPHKGAGGFWCIACCDLAGFEDGRATRQLFRCIACCDLAGCNDGGAVGPTFRCIACCDDGCATGQLFRCIACSDLGGFEDGGATWQSDLAGFKDGGAARQLCRRKACCDDGGATAWAIIPVHSLLRWLQRRRCGKAIIPVQSLLR